jgi:hypothetical protein
MARTTPPTDRAKPAPVTFQRPSVKFAIGYCHRSRSRTRRGFLHLPQTGVYPLAPQANPIVCTTLRHLMIIAAPVFPIRLLNHFCGSGVKKKDMAKILPFVSSDQYLSYLFSPRNVKQRVVYLCKD